MAQRCVAVRLDNPRGYGFSRACSTNRRTIQRRRKKQGVTNGTGGCCLQLLTQWWEWEADGEALGDAHHLRSDEELISYGAEWTPTELRANMSAKRNWAQLASGGLADLYVSVTDITGVALDAAAKEAKAPAPRSTSAGNPGDIYAGIENCLRDEVRRDRAEQRRRKRLQAKERCRRFHPASPSSDATDPDGWILPYADEVTKRDSAGSRRESDYERRGASSYSSDY